jgi:hypothetical protein
MSDPVKDLMAQYEATNQPKKARMSDADRLKQYFSTNLIKGKNDGIKKFRILPPKNGKQIFEQVYYHEMKIGADWKKIYCPKKNGAKKDPCPLCDVHNELYNSGKKEDKEIAKQYGAKMFYVTKGSDREREDDGVKFWRFRHNFKKQGTLDKIVPIFSAKADITDPVNGRDLLISLGRDDKGYTKIVSVMPEDAGPLSTNPELTKKWLDDERTHEDVYSKSSFEYLDIIASGHVPYYDKDSQKYISKEEWEKKNTSGVAVETVNEDGESEVTIGGETSQIVDETIEDVDEELNDLPF